jgi:hypothetical protein
MFIKLTAQTSTTFYINPYSICYLLKIIGGTRVYFTMQDTLDVMDTVDEIMTMAAKVK